jgi:hypothetical protein
VLIAGWNVIVVSPTANNSGYTEMIASLMACFTICRGNIGDDTTRTPGAYPAAVVPRNPRPYGGTVIVLADESIESTQMISSPISTIPREIAVTSFTDNTVADAVAEAVKYVA